jgi:hypothetical protein
VDPDTVPAFFLIADPDPVLDPGFDDQKLEKNLQLDILKKSFIDKKLQFTYP